MSKDNIATIDSLDRAIISELKSDGRKPAQAIAEVVGASAVTVRNRIKQLEDTDLLKVVAVTDFGAAGYDVLLAIGVEVDRRRPEDVGRELAAFDQVLAVNLTTGSNDLELLVAAESFPLISEFFERDIGSVKGVGRVSTAVALEVYKYQSETEAFQ